MPWRDLRRSECLDIATKGVKVRVLLSPLQGNRWCLSIKGGARPSAHHGLWRCVHDPSGIELSLSKRSRRRVVVREAEGRGTRLFDVEISPKRRGVLYFAAASLLALACTTILPPLFTEPAATLAALAAAASLVSLSLALALSRRARSERKRASACSRALRGAPGGCD
jgi:hypothetical protein